MGGKKHVEQRKRKKERGSWTKRRKRDVKAEESDRRR